MKTNFWQAYVTKWGETSESLEDLSFLFPNFQPYIPISLLQKYIKYCVFLAFISSH